MQTSETFKLNAILSFSGGLQDAYTYNVRGNIFANAQTGNIVLMGQNLLQGNFMVGLRYLLPVLSFACGVFIAEKIEHGLKDSHKVHWRQVILVVEMIILAIVGFLPEDIKLFATMMVAFSCAMQVQTFRRVRGYSYSSTMCIGNLRSGTESLSRYLRDHDRDSLNQAVFFFAIILVFALGAGIGGILTGYLGIRTIWISVGILLCALVFMFKETI